MESTTQLRAIKATLQVYMEWSQGNLVWFDPGGLGHPLPGEIQEVHQAAQIIVVQAVINGKVSFLSDERATMAGRYIMCIHN